MVRAACYLFCIIFYPTFIRAQAWDFSVPERLPASINSDYEEAFPLLAPDGKTLFFSRFLYPGNEGGKFTGSDIWISQFEASANKWSAASSPTGGLNDRSNNAVIGISGNGQTLYLLKTGSSRRPEGIYFSKKLGASWTKPEFIAIPGIESTAFFGLYVSPDFDVIFLSMKAHDSKGEEDLYVSFKNASGVWSAPKNLGASINTSGFEISPFLSADKTRLYFSSNGHKGFGDADIFYSDRLYNSWETWSAPRNLGEKLNSKKFDAYFSLYGDTTAYFSSNRTGKYADIYRVKVLPGNEVLAFGQRYLTTDELNNVLGKNIMRKITFENTTTQLSAPQKELLYYIANKLSQDKDINVQLQILEDNNPALSETRLQALSDQLVTSGVDAVRILHSPNQKSRKENKSQTIIELLLFK